MVADAMEAKRAAALRKVIIDLPLLRASKPAIAHSTNPAYLKHLATTLDTPIWPPNFDDPKKIWNLNDCAKALKFKGHVFYLLNNGDYIPTAAAWEVATAIEELCKGLCLTCVKENSLDLTKTCRNAAHAY
jgi:hypothetical protein